MERFRAQGYEPEGYTLYSYGAVQAWADAVRRAGSVDTVKVVRQLKDKPFETVLGTIAFDHKGDVTNPGYVVYQWNDGGYDYFKQ